MIFTLNNCDTASTPHPCAEAVSSGPMPHTSFSSECLERLHWTGRSCAQRGKYRAKFHSSKRLLMERPCTASTGIHDDSPLLFRRCGSPHCGGKMACCSHCEGEPDKIRRMGTRVPDGDVCECLAVLYLYSRRNSSQCACGVWGAFGDSDYCICCVIPSSHAKYALRYALAAARATSTFAEASADRQGDTAGRIEGLQLQKISLTNTPHPRNPHQTFLRHLPRAAPFVFLRHRKPVEHAGEDFLRRPCDSVRSR